MAFWNKINSQGNIDDRDRRGVRPGVIVGGGLGLTGLVIVLLMNFLGGGSVGDVLTQLQDVQTETSQSYDAKDFEGADSYEVFASKVLGSANDMWSKVFAESDMAYDEPKLVLFRTATDSGCGGADARVGPHYCPLDQTIYLDETFFDELTTRLGAEGGDVAEAYVIAHEVGHHVQYQLYDLPDNLSNEESIQLELQADCFAGLWAYSLKDLGVFEPGEIHEAIDAAGAVGDDRIQSEVTGRVNPESWTHGSSAQRIAAFNKGYESGLVKECGVYPLL
ncbi:MAG: neutral zinc metallopeptidase [Candidatus Pacebacteria bacterium]|nr:neutral zinc metallopeptidase [Candidatus Paceibacterota bacterium]MDD5357357.1 neutral zinc metallopeptidase [Candidatus Paceibacterota bacterium]